MGQRGIDSVCMVARRIKITAAFKTIHSAVSLLAESLFLFSLKEIASESVS